MRIRAFPAISAGLLAASLLATPAIAADETAVDPCFNSKLSIKDVLEACQAFIDRGSEDKKLLIRAHSVRAMGLSATGKLDAALAEMSAAVAIMTRPLPTSIQPSSSTMRTPTIISCAALSMATSATTTTRCPTLTRRSNSIRKPSTAIRRAAASIASGRTMRSRSLITPRSSSSILKSPRVMSTVAGSMC